MHTLGHTLLTEDACPDWYVTAIIFMEILSRESYQKSYSTYKDERPYLYNVHMLVFIYYLLGMLTLINILPTGHSYSMYWGVNLLWGSDKTDPHGG